MQSSSTTFGGGAGTGRVRWQIPLVLMITVFIGYLDRGNINLALPKIAETYGWTKAQTGEYGGLLMSIFYIAYGLANIFISPLGERFGPRKSLLCIVVLWSVFTALGGVLGLMFVPFIITRVFLGLSEGIHFPMMNTLTKEWFPANERSRGNGIYVVGIFVASILGPIFLVPIVDVAGWRIMFVILGGIGLVVSLPLIWRFIHDTPRKHPRITLSEVSYIEAGMERDETAAGGSFWSQVKPFLSSLPFWVALLGGILNNAIAHGLLNWLPTYFTQERGLPFSELWYVVSLPYVFSIFGVILWSYLGDRTNRRALIAGIGFIVTAGLTYFAATGATILVTVLLFSLTIFVNMTYPSNEFAIMQRILPRNRVATGVGLYNGLAMMIGGGLGPVIVGTVVSMTGSYTSGIMTLGALCLLAGAVMITLHRIIRY
jgi:MFS family permease